MSADVMDILWRNALGIIPLVIIVAAMCRWLPLRPATKHALWLVTLACLVAPPLIPGGVIPELLPAAPEADAMEGPAGSVAPAALAPAPAPSPLVRTTLPTTAPPHAASARDAQPMRGFGGTSAPGRAVAPREPLSAGRPGAADERLVAVPRLRGPSGFVRIPAPLQPKVSAGLPAKHAHAASHAIESHTTGHKALEPAGRIEPAALWSPWKDVAPAGATAPPAAFLPEPAQPRKAPRTRIAALRESAGQAWDSAAAAMAPLGEAVGAWGVYLADVRRAIASAPPAPPLILLSGTLVVLLIVAWRTIAFARIFRGAAPATPEALALVREAAQRMGLASPPETVMVADCVSPMVWCGVRPRLILPVALWDELDDIGRRSVIHHELAHIRRRDHWTRWAEIVIGAIYWWHPLVWWIRKRLHDEADLSCDAWVGAHLPGQRRAYAQALLKTRQFLSGALGARPAVGLGAASAGKRQFARRLTMVMTSRVRHRASLAGVALAAMVALGGVVATPLWACPDQQRESRQCAKDRAAVIQQQQRQQVQRKAEASKAKAKAEAHSGGKVKARIHIHGGAAGEGEAKQGDGLTTFERHMQEREQPGAPGMVGHDHEADHRLHELEERLDRLSEMIERLHRDRVGRGGAAGGAEGGALSLGEALSGGFINGLGKSITVSPRGDVVAPAPSQNTSETIERAYSLPADQLELMTALMSRDDVPILIRPGDGQITVFATPGQHRVFGAFVDAISPQASAKRWQTYAIPEGKREAITSLMSLSSVPIFVRSRNDALGVQGTNAEHQIFGAFLSLIAAGGAEGATPEADTPAPGAPPRAPSPATGPAANMRPAAARVADMARRRLELEQQRIAMEEQRQALEQAREQLEQDAEARSAEMEAIEGSVEAIEEEAEQVIEESRTLDRAARAAALERFSALRSEAANLRSNMWAMRLAAEELRHQALTQESAAEAIESHMEAVEHEVEALADESMALEDELRNHLDAVREAAESALSNAGEALREQIESIEEALARLVESMSEEALQSARAADSGASTAR